MDGSDHHGSQEDNIDRRKRCGSLTMTVKNLARVEGRVEANGSAVADTGVLRGSIEMAGPRMFTGT